MAGSRWVVAAFDDSHREKNERVHGGVFVGCLEDEPRVLVGLVETDSRVGLHDFIPDPDQELLFLGIEADAGIEALKLLLDSGVGATHGRVGRI